MSLRVLFLGGTGNISGAVTRHAVDCGLDVTVANRSGRAPCAGARAVRCDVHDARALDELAQSHPFDVVVDWIAFTPEDIERDIAAFSGRTGQFVFISSASVYQKPPTCWRITESTPLHNPYWDYAQNKIACEERLVHAYRTAHFPAVVVRPSLTYDTLFPIALGGWGCFTLAQRIRDGRPIVIHGDGTSLWTVTHAADFALGFVPLLGDARTIGHAFHITSDEVLTWNQIYAIIADALGRTLHCVHLATETIVAHHPELTGTLLGDKAHSTVFDNSKVRSFVPGFTAQIPFWKGIARTVAWFEADASRRRIDPAEDALLDSLVAIARSQRPERQDRRQTTA